MDIFSKVKEEAAIEDVLDRYGIELRNNKALCPFHGDTRPSMSVKGNFFKCWSCGERGSVIDFVMKMEGCDPIEAAKMLNDWFGLGLGARKPTAADMRRYGESKRIVEEFEADFKKAEKRLYEIMRLFNRVLEDPMKSWEEATPLYIVAAAEKEHLEHVLDSIGGFDFAGKVENYRDIEKYLAKLEERIL
jgi:DNA primase